MTNHACLGQREADEDADGIQRDEQGRRAAEERDEADGDGRQQDDAPGVRESIAPERELAGHVAVGGEEGGQARERVVRRVRGEEQDQHRRDEEGRLEDRSPRRYTAPETSEITDG